VVLEVAEQVADLHVGVTIASVRRRTALAEQTVDLVEEQHQALALATLERVVEVLLGLADPLADQWAQVDAKESPAQLGCQHFGREDLTRVRGPRCIGRIPSLGSWCRVARESCRSRPPSDPYVRKSRIRLLGSRVL
jgi:hypothetical protein